MTSSNYNKNYYLLTSSSLISIIGLIMMLIYSNDKFYDIYYINIGLIILSCGSFMSVSSTIITFHCKNIILIYNLIYFSIITMIIKKFVDGK